MNDCGEIHRLPPDLVRRATLLDEELRAAIADLGRAIRRSRRVRLRPLASCGQHARLHQPTVPMPERRPCAGNNNHAPKR